MLFLIGKINCSSENEKAKVREGESIVSTMVRKEEKIVPGIKSYDWVN